jgi:hypothetical protein
MGQTHYTSSSKFSKSCYVINSLNDTSPQVTRSTYFVYFHTHFRYSLIFCGGDPGSKIIFKLQKSYVGCFFPARLMNTNPNAPPHALPVLRCKPQIGEVEQLMMETRKMIAVIITSTQSKKKNSLECQAIAYQSSRKKKHPIKLICNVERSTSCRKRFKSSKHTSSALHVYK